MKKMLMFVVLFISLNGVLDARPSSRKKVRCSSQPGQMNVPCNVGRHLDRGERTMADYRILSVNHYDSTGLCGNASGVYNWYNDGVDVYTSNGCSGVFDIDYERNN